MKLLSIIMYPFIYMFFLIYRILYIDIIKTIFELLVYIFCLNIIQIIITLVSFVIGIIYDICIFPFVLLGFTFIYTKEIWNDSYDKLNSFKVCLVLLSGEKEKFKINSEEIN